MNLSRSLLVGLVAVGCSKPAPAPTIASTPVPAAKADLSTAENARSSIYNALKREDKEAFRSMVSKRMLEKQQDFDGYYKVWQSAAAEGGPEKFNGIRLTQEDGQFKLDEN